MEVSEIKLLEVQKSQNIASYPTQWINRKDVIIRDGLKSSNKPEVVINGKSNIQSQTFINDAAKVWNNAPSVIKECTTLSSVKKQIKIFVCTLPIKKFTYIVLGVIPYIVTGLESMPSNGTMYDIAFSYSCFSFIKVHT